MHRAFVCLGVRGSREEIKQVECTAWARCTLARDKLTLYLLTYSRVLTCLLTHLLTHSVTYSLAYHLLTYSLVLSYQLTV